MHPRGKSFAHDDATVLRGRKGGRISAVAAAKKTRKKWKRGRGDGGARQWGGDGSPS